MNVISNDNIILFPKTVDYYQVELTRLLETERYAEAADLLRFLIRCSGEEPGANEEWNMLLHWLESEFPQAAQEVEQSEEDMLQHRVSDKSAKDDHYVKKLLEMLLESSTIEKKLIALEQLAYANHPGIDNTLKRWIENVELHPFVQFKALQTLKKRGITGKLRMMRNGESLMLEVAEIPANDDEYPESIRRILGKVTETCEVSYPMLTYFSEQLWKEFLSYVYGTSVYERMVDSGDNEQLCWAAALHHAALEALLGSADELESMRLYEIGPEERLDWERAHRAMKNALAALKSLK